MEEKRSSVSYPPHRQTQILSRIVDAMLDAASDLRQASVEDWTRILAEACRRQKRKLEISTAMTC